MKQYEITLEHGAGGYSAATRTVSVNGYDHHVPVGEPAVVTEAVYAALVDAELVPAGLAPMSEAAAMNAEAVPEATPVPEASQSVPPQGPGVAPPADIGPAPVQATATGAPVTAPPQAE